MNNFKYLQTMSRQKLAEWLDENGQFDNSPWMLWFDRTYCKNCPAVICIYEDSNREFPAAWCEVNGGKCKFFPEMDRVPDSLETIKLWLETDIENE